MAAWALVFCASLSCAQVFVESPRLLGKPIDTIEITGNPVTRAEIILREMKTHPGSKANVERLELDLLRIRALGLFSHVEFSLTEREGRSVLVISVNEEWYIFPLPYWDFKDNDPEKPIYGFRYRQNNFRGRNETLVVSLWSGADRGFLFSHNTPWMKGTPGLSRAVDFSQHTTKSGRLAVKDLNLEERHSSAEVRVGKRWTIELFSEIGARFRLVEAGNRLQLATGGQLDRILEAKATAYWDQRDLRIFPRRGFFIGGTFINGWILDGSDRYQRVILDLRGYLPLRKRISGAARFTWQPGWGNVPPYDWIVVSDTSPLRSSNLSDEGTSYYGFSLETRMDLLPLRQFTWEKAPLLPQYFKNLEYGLSAEVFLDAGDAYLQNAAPTWSSLLWGYGAGLLFQLPYIDVFRLELSLNPEYSLREARLSGKVEISF